MRLRAPVLLEGGLVVDGSGGPSWPGDVLLVGDRIAARRRAACATRLPEGLALEDVEVLDCRGLVIAPGFIDAHTHDDAIVLDDAGLPAQAVAGHHHGRHRQLRHLARALRDRRGRGRRSTCSAPARSATRRCAPTATP